MFNQGPNDYTKKIVLQNLAYKSASQEDKKMKDDKQYCCVQPKI